MATCPTCRTRYDEGVVTCEKDGERLLPDEAFSAVDVDLQPGTQVGEYRIEQKLGEGGFGAVYRARHPLIGKTAAIKVLARELSAKPEIVARFIDEARAVNQIRHKGIIDIFSFGTVGDGRHYFVMELLEGLPLDAYLRQRGPMPIAEALPILRGIARAVDAAHQAGIAHRDLKPENVFLVFDDDGGAHTKLLDFGIAKLFSEQSGRTRTGAPIGTPHYMSPEQARGVNVDSRTDVYSFGAMIFEMLTGRLPFEGATIMDTLMKQISEAPAAPSSVLSEIPKALDAPVLHMLEKDPEKRPASLSAALDELASAAATEGVTVAPTSNVRIAPSVRDAHGPTIAATLPAPSKDASKDASLIGASSEVSQSSSRRTWWAVAAFVAIAGVGAFVFAKRDHTTSSNATTANATGAIAAASTATSRTSASATSLASASAATTTTDASNEVVLTIESTPPGVEIYLGAQKIGVAPGPIRLPRNSGKSTLTVKARGFASREISVDASHDNTMNVVLTPHPQGTATSSARSGISQEIGPF